MSIFPLLIKSLNSFVSVIVGFLGSSFLSIFFQFASLFLTRTDNHQQVLILCIQISFCLLHLNYFFLHCIINTID